MKEKVKMARLEARIPVYVKEKAVRDSARCGLSTSQYITQLINGCTPRSFSPDICRLLERIDSLHDFIPMDDHETNALIRSLIYEIRNELILPSKGGGD